MSTKTENYGLNKFEKTDKVLDTITGLNENFEIIDLELKKAKQIVYSTEEQEIGTWIDGSKIYRKTFSITIDLASNGKLEIPHGITGFSNLINGSITVKGTWEEVWFCDSSFSLSNKAVRVTSNNIIIYDSNGTNWAGCTYNVTIEYTKSEVVEDA